MKDLWPAWPILDPLWASARSGSKTPCRVMVSAGVPYLAARLAAEGVSVCVVTDEERAETWAQDARTFASAHDALKDWSIGFLPAGAAKERNVLLEEAQDRKGIVWFTSLSALREPCFKKSEFQDARLALKVGRAFNYAKLLDHLSRFGYHRTGFVEEVGEFAARGEVFDLWPPHLPKPLRLVFNLDIVESMHYFEPGDQRASEFVAETAVIPLGDRMLGRGALEGTISEFFPSGTALVLDRMRLTEDQELEFPFAGPVIELASGGVDGGLVPSSRVRLNWALFKRELGENAAAGLKNIVFCRNMGEAHRLEEILDGLHCPDEIRPQLPVGPLSAGFVGRGLGLAIWSFGDLTGVPVLPRRLPKFKSGRALDSMSEIRPGDYVVHERYGIGRYRGLERVHLTSSRGRGRSAPREKISEFLALEYKSGDRLLVPIQDFRLVQKFVGQEGKKPQLNSLDGAAWERVKQKVKTEIAEMAKDLLETAAMRSASARPEHAEAEKKAVNEHLFREFEEAFPYDETPDQTAAVDDIKKDMDSHFLMDRVVCGDVGYGKTEIAMRAAFKAVLDGGQVLVLVPTTILAEQHFKNFTERFAAFPVRIALISRFQKTDLQKSILADLAAGSVDIIIGTHRLLQKDVHPKNLSLIVIDEEHRFGVQQKENLKKMKLTADILALSATPIPRTLSQAMGGIRGISLIETPPEGRLPIETTVGLYSEKLVKSAIQRELARGGQVFYVHNRISSIDTRRKSLEKLVPGLRVGLAHGQMSGDALEDAMWNFLQKKWDVLLATSIIESGLDIPSVNTLIVEDSEEFGLAQLYQLRGRVGRKKEKAYCHLFFSDWANLSQDARKRLDAIQEFSALGSGMKLAVRDLEIRGTGNLLGPQQHGWINAVGMEMYCQLLGEEVQRLKDERGLVLPEPSKKFRPEKAMPEVEMEISAYLPDSYVDSAGERISLYKKLISCAAETDVDILRRELADRFGPLPEPADNLLKVASLKIAVAQANAVSVAETDRGIILGWPVKDGKIPLDLGRFAADHSGSMEILPPDEKRSGSGVIEILFFRPEAPDPDSIETVRNLLKISNPYVIISPFKDG